MAFNYRDVLAGPIVRRVDQRVASVWVALAKPGRVTLRLWEGEQQTFNEASQLTSATVSTRPIGGELHLALAVVTRPDNAGSHLKSDTLYFYDLEIAEADGSDPRGLNALGLLGSADAQGNKCPLPLGYATGRLPCFVLPPADPDKVVLLQGSCRSPHSSAEDGMPPMDDLLSGGETYKDPLKRPHQLFLTGDQIYADELAPCYLELANTLGRRLMDGNGGPAEFLPVEHDGRHYDLPVNLELFPPARRQRLIRSFGFTSGAGDSHVLSFGEFAALYLLAWSEAVWPADFLENALNDHKGRIGHYHGGRQGWVDMVESYNFEEDEDRQQAGAKADYHDGARLLKEDWRRIDKALTHPDRVAEWGDENLGGLSALVSPPDTTDGVSGTVTLPANAPAGLARTLARLLTPSWFAGVHELGFASASGRECYHDKGLEYLRALQVFRAGLPRVRRLLANIPTYMTFDDHEVTDDWNITRNWIGEVNGNPLGTTVLRNGMLAFGLFQGWGNDPAAWEQPGPGRQMLEQAQALFPQQPDDPDPTAARALDRLFAIGNQRDAPVADRVQWHYRVGGPGYEVISLDTRTFRGFDTDDGPPKLLTLEALQAQIPESPSFSFGNPPQGRQGITFVIAAAPVLGFAPVEYLVQPLTNTADRLARFDDGQLFAPAAKDYFTGLVNHDPEPWSYHEDIVEALLARLAPYRRIAFLSGDVHYASAAKLDYWRFTGQNQIESSRFLQLTASAFKNYAGKFKFSLFRHGLVSRLAALVALPRERLAWEDTQDKGAPLTPPQGVEFTDLIKRRLAQDTALIPVAGLPPDCQQAYRPSWGWRLDLLRDQRPDAERFAGVTVPAFQDSLDGFDSEFLARLAGRHYWQAVHGPSRVITFASNFGRITLATGADTPTLTFSLHFQMRELPDGGVKPFLTYTVPLDATGENPPQLPVGEDEEANASARPVGSVG